MNETLLEQLGRYRNFVLLGEGGCGKSELAINLARYLLPLGKDVHLFDMDMTKPLFRTREQAAELEKLGVQVHFEQQFADAPTQVGGVSLRLRDGNCYAILDVGGDHIGARAIGLQVRKRKHDLQDHVLQGQRFRRRASHIRRSRSNSDRARR